MGNAEQILREKYGEEIEIKKFEKVKGGCQKNYHPQKIMQIKLISTLEEKINLAKVWSLKKKN